MVAGSIVKGAKVAGRFKDVMPLLMSSLPGALFSGGFTTLSTGNHLAGLTVAGADLLGSTALASGIGALGGKTGTRKILGKDVRLAGGRVTKLRPDEDIPKKARSSKEAFEQLIKCKAVTSVLTSGKGKFVLENRTLTKEIIQLYKDKINIILGYLA